MLAKPLLCLLLIFSFFPALSHAQDERPRVTSLVNRPILIKDNWSGQSIMLIKENGHYFVVRTVFGSGVPVVATKRYDAVLNSDYQLSFSGTMQAWDKQPADEKFTLTMEDHGFSLYLNGLKVFAE